MSNRTNHSVADVCPPPPCHAAPLTEARYVVGAMVCLYFVGNIFLTYLMGFVETDVIFMSKPASGERHKIAVKTRIGINDSGGEGKADADKASAGGGGKQKEKGGYIADHFSYEMVISVVDAGSGDPLGSATYRKPLEKLFDVVRRCVPCVCAARARVCACACACVPGFLKLTPAPSVFL